MATGAVIAGILGVGATTAAIIAAGINMAISFAASYLLAKQAKSGGTPSASDYKQTVQQEKAAQRVFYGRRKASIVMNFAEEQDGTQDISNTSGESHEKLYMSGMICNHPVHSYGDVYLDDKHIDEYEGKAIVEHVNGLGIIPDFLLDETVQYESSMTGSEGYWIAMKCTHDSTLFSGIPSPKVVIEGKKVKDFRTGQMVYTNNAALVIADFYISYMKIPESRLIMSGTGSFIDAANLCDEIMSDGNKRYEINGMFELDALPSDILNEMLKSCGGTLVRMNGVIGLLPAAYYGDVTPFVIAESDIVGSISMSPQESLSDCVNIMSGTYVEEEDDWSEQDFPPIRDEAAIVRDGFEVAGDIDYTYVTNALQAQRLVNIELRRRTAGGFTELRMSPKGAYCRVGRVVEMDLPQLGLSGEFRITSQVENEDLTFTITMQREDINIYDDAIGEPYSPPPLLDLGGGTLASPSGLQFVYSYNDAVGNVIQGVLTWQNNSAATSYFNVVIEKTNGDIVQSGDTKGYVFNVNALPIGNYLGKVRSVDSRGRTSSYATTSFSVGEPKVPASFRDIASPDDGQMHTLYARSNWNIAITPNIIGGTPQGTEFEFWHLADSGSYIAGQPEYDEGSFNLATLVATASSLNNGGLIPDRWQHYWVRSVNPYGKSDFIYLQTGTAKEQDLVTTVVERLKAIEVESQNWLADPETNWSEYGYKLFSAATGAVTMPDGTVLDNPDGLAVFQNAIINGHITAKSLTFIDKESIPAEIDNTKMYETSNLMRDNGTFTVSETTKGIDSGWETLPDNLVPTQYAKPNASSPPVVDYVDGYSEVRQFASGEPYFWLFSNNSSDTPRFYFAPAHNAYNINVDDRSSVQVSFKITLQQSTALSPDKPYLKMGLIYDDVNNSDPNAWRTVYLDWPQTLEYGTYQINEILDLNREAQSNNPTSPCTLRIEIAGNTEAYVTDISVNQRVYVPWEPTYTFFEEDIAGVQTGDVLSIGMEYIGEDADLIWGMRSRDGAGNIIWEQSKTISDINSFSWELDTQIDMTIGEVSGNDVSFFLAKNSAPQNWDDSVHSSVSVRNIQIARGSIYIAHYTPTSDPTMYSDQSPLQISGGGYSSNPNQGWGIHENGYAEFLGGMNTEGATISGATIIASDIYSGNVLFYVDYDTNGTANDIRYYDLPDVRLAARASYTSSVVKTHSRNAWVNQTEVVPYEFNVISARERRGAANSSRFRWGKVRANAMEIETISTTDFWDYGCRLHIRGYLKDPKDGSKDRVTGWVTVGYGIGGNATLTIGQLVFDIYPQREPSNNAFTGGVRIVNRECATFGSSDDTYNGQVVIEMYSTHGNISGLDTMQTRMSLSVDNDNFPG
ncbi:putative tail protein [Vibrio phage 168E36-1]|nr:putative tail protein [Vibrio phage 168E36-1]